jgi:hypothetical protein
MKLIWEEPGYRHPTTVVHHCLRTIEILSFSDCSRLLDSLILPKLRKFYLQIYSGTGEREAFLGLLTRSNCKLYELELHGCVFEPFIECLEQESFKSIRKLEISFGPQFTDDELIRLTDFPSPLAPPVLLPKLKHLRLHRCLHASRGMLAKMVVSRRRQRDGRKAEPLQYLGVTTEELYEEDVVSIEYEVTDGFEAYINPDYILNENREREEEGSVSEEEGSDSEEGSDG